MNLNNPKVVLILIALLFFGPVLIAVLMRSEWWDFKPTQFNNLGTMVQPPVPLGLDHDNAVTDTEPRWTVLYPLAGDCDSRCVEDVSSLRQIHLASGRKRDQLAVVLLAREALPETTHDRLQEIYAGFELRADSSGQAAKTLESLQGDPAFSGFGSGQAFILDPAGNIMLSYAPGFDPNHINKDLKRLLKWSGQEK